MKRVFYFLAFIIILSCEKNSSENEGGKKVEYQLTTSTDDSFTVLYNNEEGGTVGGLAKTGWKHSFNTSQKPFTALIRGVYQSGAYTPSLSITVNILVDGQLVKSETGNYDVTAQYVIQ